MSAISLQSLLNLYRTYLSFRGKKNVKADITLLLEGGDSVTMPVVPSNLPKVSNPQNNDVFNSVIGDISIMGLLGLRTVEFEDFLLPSNTDDYSWAKGDDVSTIINFINDNRQKGQPFRIIITKGDVTYLNMSCLINEFDYYQDGMADYHMDLSLVEYRTYNEQVMGLEA